MRPRHWALPMVGKAKTISPFEVDPTMNGHDTTRPNASPTTDGRLAGDAWLMNRFHCRSYDLEEVAESVGRARWDPKGGSRWPAVCDRLR